MQWFRVHLTAPKYSAYRQIGILILLPNQRVPAEDDDAGARAEAIEYWCGLSFVHETSDGPSDETNLLAMRERHAAGELAGDDEGAAWHLVLASALAYEKAGQLHHAIEYYQRFFEESQTFRQYNEFSGLSLDWRLFCPVTLM